MTTYTPKRLREILDAHGKWMRSEPGGVPAYLVDANLASANLVDAYLASAYLARANLDGITVSWSSHELLSEILWRAADTKPRRMLAAYVGRMTDWCWEDWSAWEHPERGWAIAELAKLVKPDDGAPELIRAAVGVPG